MLYLNLALRNVFRHRSRSAATLLAIAVGVASLILAGGFVQDIFVQLAEAIIHSQTGHVQVAKKGYREGKARAAENYLIASPEKLRAELSGRIGVQSVVTRLGFAGVLNNGKRDLGIIGEGVEPEGEAAIGTYLRYIEGGPLGGGSSDGIVVGQGVARSLGLKVGDRVTLMMRLAQGAVNTLDFEVKGVFQSFSKDFDARAVRIALPAARELMDTQAAHLMVVMLQRTENTPVVMAALKPELEKQGYEIFSWNELSDFYEKAKELYDRQFGVLRLIILLMVLLSVANSINMTLFERTREFGTMRALGDRPVNIFALIMTESATLGLIGALLGMLLGVVAAFAISAIGIPMPPPPNANLGYTAVIRIDASSVLVAGAVGFIASCLAALLPARRAASMDVVEALRHGM